MTAMLSVRVYAEVNGPINAGISCRPEHDRMCFLVACEENAQALAYLSEALNCLDRRTHNREVRGVEGTWGL